ncbi:hypothetical protein BKA70DRAFT_1565156 [Coprinopsis sp. MPI-PUGE-AT-0042]|nr:hypothetical protein BKA70DRAFT_1565156 [Coprinopsis sp. MPI-PUGE-AT-0042]
MRFAYVVPAVILATQACALNFLEARQFEAFANMVPEQCRSECDPIISTLSTCAPSDLACSCTPSATNDLEVCIDCLRDFVGEAGGDAAIDAFDQQVDPLMEMFRDTCANLPTDDDASASTTPSSTRQVVVRPSTSADDDSTSTPVTTRTREQTVVRPTPSSGTDNGDSTSGDNNDSLGDLGGGASSLTLSFGGAAAAAAGAFFLL